MSVNTCNTTSRNRTTPEDLLLWSGVGAFGVTIWPILIALRAPAPVGPVSLLAHVCGMLAGYGIAVLIALMSRTPILESVVGSDRVTRWHARVGRAVITLAVVHAVAAWMAGEQSHNQSWTRSLWRVLRLPWLPAATLGTALLLTVAAVSGRAVRRRVSYERWHAVHLTVYLAVAFAFMHELAGPDLVGHRVAQVLWALMYTSAFALVLQYRVITPIRNATRHRTRVAAVNHEIDGVVSIVITGQDLDQLHARAGQFFRWRFLTPDHWKTAHPFSLSAPPTSNQLRITVKALGNSTHTLQGLEPGTWVVAEGPYGAMTADRRTQRDVLLIAGGVGITPMRALFEELSVESDQDLVLLYRAKGLDDIIFRGELERIAAARLARLHYLLSDRTGPMTAALLHHYVPNLVERDVYLCGPPGFAAATRSALREAGVPAGQIQEERFDV